MDKLNYIYPKVIKIGHGKSSCTIHIPIKLARDMGFVNTEFAFIKGTKENGLEVKKYDGEKGIKEYIQGIEPRSD